VARFGGLDTTVSLGLDPASDAIGTPPLDGWGIVPWLGSHLWLSPKVRSPWASFGGLDTTDSLGMDPASDAIGTPPLGGWGFVPCLG
jgi:hypothetical protein